MTVQKSVKNKETGETSIEEVTISKDECNRPSTTAEGLASLQSVRGEGGFVTAGNASQLSDGASVCVLMESKQAEQRGRQNQPDQQDRGSEQQQASVAASVSHNREYENAASGVQIERRR